MSATRHSAGKTITTVIEALDPHGTGLGQVGGERVLVPGALPGERVSAALTGRIGKRGPLRATLLAVELAHPERRRPPCPVWSADCACPLMPLGPAAQAEHKRQLVVEALREVWPDAQALVAPTVGAAPSEHYRSKLSFVVARHGGRPVLGAYRRDSHEPRDLDGCIIGEPCLDAAARCIRALLQGPLGGISVYDEQSGSGELRYVTMRAVARGQALVTLMGPSAAAPAWAAHAAQALMATEGGAVAGVFWAQNASRGNAIWVNDPTLLAGQDALDEEVNGLRFRASPRAFFQVHRQAAERLRADLLSGVSAALGGRGMVWDLFCGVGTNALLFARHGFDSVGVESVEVAVADARMNADANGLPATRFVAADLDANAAATLAGLGGAPDAVVLNPPRKGATAALLDAIAEQRPRVIAYVACAPRPVASAIARFDAAYRLVLVTPYDLFPHTEHTETLALWLRRDVT